MVGHVKIAPKEREGNITDDVYHDLCLRLCTIIINVKKRVTHQMPKRCVKVWYDILEEAVGNLSSPKHHPLSSGKGIHSDMSCTIIITFKHRHVLL